MKASLLFRMGRPRHPLLRIALGAVALSLLALASVFVMAMAGAILLGWLVRRAYLRLSGSRPASAAPRQPSADVLEGEYRVVRQRSELLPR